jgi:hypothetical protein
MRTLKVKFPSTLLSNTLSLCPSFCDETKLHAPNKEEWGKPREKSVSAVKLFNEIQTWNLPNTIHEKV